MLGSDSGGSKGSEGAEGEEGVEDVGEGEGDRRREPLSGAMRRSDGGTVYYSLYGEWFGIASVRGRREEYIIVPIRHRITCTMRGPRPRPLDVGTARDC